MGTKITLYIGLADKETKVQKIPTQEAERAVMRALGFDATITHGKGTYTHEDKSVVFENTLLVEIFDFDNSISREELTEKVIRIKKDLNQEKVAVNFEKSDSYLW